MTELVQGIYFIDGKQVIEVSDEINKLTEEEASKIYPETRLFRYRPNIDLKEENFGILPDVEQEITNNQLIVNIHSEGNDRIIKQYIKYIDVTNPELKIIGSESYIIEGNKYESYRVTMEGITSDIDLDTITNVEIVIWCHNLFTNCAKVYIASKNKSENLSCTDCYFPIFRDWDEELINGMRSFAKGGGVDLLKIDFEVLEDGGLVSFLKNCPPDTKNILINLNKENMQIKIITQELDSYICAIITMCFQYCNYLWV